MEAKGHDEQGGPIHCLIIGKDTLAYQIANEADGCCPDWKNGKIDFTVNEQLTRTRRPEQ